MGIVRALVALVVIAIAVSPLVSGRPSESGGSAAVYAAGEIIFVQDRKDKDNEKKEENRQRDEDSRGNREKTREEKDREKDEKQRENDLPRTTTNAGSLDNFQLEGQVQALNCGVEPKEIVIRTVDGDATLYQGPRDPVNRIDRLYCGDLVVGDYVFVQEAAKRNEGAYDAYYISCQQEREEGPDNTNDNDDDVDPNCTHIWNHHT